jgi:hypothetical protein
MTAPAPRAGAPRTLQHDPSGDAFQAAIRRATVGRVLAQGGRPGSQGGGPGAFRAPYEGGGAPVSARTGALIADAIGYDKTHDPKSPESARRWKAVQEAIAGEILPMLPTHSILGPDPTQGPQFSTELTRKVQLLGTWLDGKDNLAQATQGAFDRVDVDLRKQLRDRILDDQIKTVNGNLDQIEDVNDDHSFIRKGWEGLFGGAGEDFENYVEGKRDDLVALDNRDDNGMSDEEFQKQLLQIIGDYEGGLELHSKKLADSDETWHTAGEVGRVITATTVGIVATAASGGNFWIGFGAAAITYEVIDGVNDLRAGDEGVHADGHTAITTGLIDLFGGGGDGWGMSSQNLKSWAMDNGVDLISSASTAGATKFGMFTTKAMTPKIAALGTGGWSMRFASVPLAGRVIPAIATSPGKLALGQISPGTRIVSTAWGGTAAQLLNGGGYVASDMTRLGFDGKLDSLDGWKQVGRSGVTQLQYLATAPLASGIAGAIPVYKVVTPKAGAPTATAASAATNAATSKFKLSWIGLGGQFVNDTSWNFVSTYWVTNGHITTSDAIATLGSSVPGTVQNIAVRPDTRQRIEAWRSGNRDLTLVSMPTFSKPKFPPSRIKMAPIATLTLGLRAVMSWVDANTGLRTSTGVHLTDAANRSAVPFASIRSSLSKGSWFYGNWRLIPAYEAALRGDKQGALDLLSKVESRRRRYGIKISEKPGELTKAREKIELLAEVGQAYSDARKALALAQSNLGPNHPDLTATMPDIRIRDLADPTELLARLQHGGVLDKGMQLKLLNFNPNLKLLQNSNIVEGLLTDPDFVITALAAISKQKTFGPKVRQDDIETIRLIYRTQKVIEADASDGGYNLLLPGLKWSNLDWDASPQAGKPNKPTVLGEELTRLTDYADQFLGKSQGKQATRQLLQAVIDAWKAYLPLHAQSQSKPVTELKADYQAAVDKLPLNIKALMPDADNAGDTTPQALIARLQQDGAVPRKVRDRLEKFDPNMYVIDNSPIVEKLLTDPDLLLHSIDALGNKLKPAQREAIKLVLDLWNILKIDAGDGGYNKLQPGVKWNELVWRPITGKPNKVPLLNEEMARLDSVIDHILHSTKDQHGNELPGLRPLLETWKAYTKLYSETQHELGKTYFEPGIERKVAEQDLGSSASPDTVPGYLLKGAAYALALNLLYSWAFKATPDTQGGLQVALTVAYIGEMMLAVYNPWGVTGYTKRLGDMTDFKARYDENKYRPSDIPDAMKDYDPVLANRFKELEGKRQFWNLVGDIGSGISAFRNAVLGVAFFAMGFKSLGFLAMGNAIVSLGWLVSQRQLPDAPGFRNANASLQKFFIDHPNVKLSLRKLSIWGGWALASSVALMAWLKNEEIKKEQGDQGETAVTTVENWVRDLVDWLIEEGDGVNSPPENRNPLPDRA